LKIEPGKYIWKAKSGDQEVVVLSALGTGPDGRLYVKIEGSNTGIPFDECHKEKGGTLSRKPRPKRLF